MKWTLFGIERDWGYRCVLTLPQIELMQADLPHTLYKRHGGKSSKGRRTSDEHVVVDAECIRLTEEANRRYQAKQKVRRQEKGYTPDELLAGLAEIDKGEI